MDSELTYIKGFNSGHKLAEYNPELWAKLKPSLSEENDYERGVLEGAAEFEKTQEKSREADLNNLRKDQEQSKDASKSR